MVKKICVGGLLCAIAVLFPQLFHAFGASNAGAVFLPMHIPVLISGFLLGPWFGLVLGVISPAVSTLIMGMPSVSRLPFMCFELAAYGFAAGLLYYTFSLNSKKGGLLISLLSSMAFGRIIYAISLLIACKVFRIDTLSPTAVFSATALGLPGIIIQIVLIPTLIIVLQKGGLIDAIKPHRKGNSRK